MSPTPKELRDQAIREYLRLEGENRRMAAEGVDRNERRKVIDQANQIQQAYFNGLPRVPMSRCPFTGEPLVRVFDPWGVDGFWWQETESGKTQDPAAPATFRVLRGALNLNGLPALGGPAEAHVGPDVPYVIARVLSMPTMVMVVSSLPMLNGYTAYPLAYFSTEAPPPGSLVATWRRLTYSFVDRKGDSCWYMPSDVWDFDLKPWVEAGKVLWIEPGDAKLVVQKGHWDKFPFKDLQGTRLDQTIIRDKLHTGPPPDGTPYQPFE